MKTAFFLPIPPPSCHTPNEIFSYIFHTYLTFLGGPPSPLAARKPRGGHEDGGGAWCALGLRALLPCFAFRPRDARRGEVCGYASGHVFRNALFLRVFWGMVLACAEVCVLCIAFNFC